MTDNLSTFVHYDPVEGTLVEPIDKLKIKSLTVVDVDDENNEGIAIEADISIANAKNLRVQTIEGVENDEPESVGEKEIDLIGSIVFDPGFGIYMGGSMDKLQRYVVDTVTVPSWTSYPFNSPVNTTFTIKCVRIGDQVTLTMGFATPNANAAANHPGGTLTAPAGTVPAVYRPTRNIEESSGYAYSPNYILNPVGQQIPAETPIWTSIFTNGGIQFGPLYYNHLFPAGTYNPGFLTEGYQFSVTYNV